MQAFIALIGMLVLWPAASRAQIAIPNQGGLPIVQVNVTLPPVNASVVPLRVFLFTATQGYHHDSIETAVPVLQQIGAQRKWVVFQTNDYHNLTEARLKETDVLVFLLTSGIATNGTAQRLAIQEFIGRGGGWVGVHSASDSEYDWTFYSDNFLGGAYFSGHPDIQQATVNPAPALSGCVPQSWKHTDEWYNFGSNPAAKNAAFDILLTVDESTYKGGTMGSVHPMAWRRLLPVNTTLASANATDSRTFYIALGHGPSNFTSDDIFLPLVVGGIEWAGKRRPEICLFDTFSAAPANRQAASVPAMVAGSSLVLTLSFR